MRIVKTFVVAATLASLVLGVVGMGLAHKGDKPSKEPRTSPIGPTIPQTVTGGTATPNSASAPGASLYLVWLAGPFVLAGPFASPKACEAERQKRTHKLATACVWIVE